MRDSKEEKDLATQHDKSFDITLFCNNHFDVVSSFADTLTVKELSRLRRVSTHFNQFFKTSFNHNRSLAITRFCDSNSDIVSALADNLTVKEVSRLRRVSTCFNQFFKPNFSRRTAPTCVVEGNILSLKNSDPSQLFVIHEEIIAPRGQRYFNCSAFQLMTFLCDDDMKTEIFNLESVVNYLKDDEKKAMREKQYAQIDCGGADLIMLGHDPHTIIKKQGFKGLTLSYPVKFEKKSYIKQER